MQSLSDAGIYLFVDLDTVGTYIEANDPAWTQSMYQAYSAVMDAFQSYDNTAGFFVGNEVMTTGNSSIAAPYVKAAARDMKAYRDSKGYRDIPVGYSAGKYKVLHLTEIADLTDSFHSRHCGSEAESSELHGLQL